MDDETMDFIKAIACQKFLRISFHCLPFEMIKINGGRFEHYDQFTPVHSVILDMYVFKDKQLFLGFCENCNKFFYSYEGIS